MNRRRLLLFGNVYKWVTGVLLKTRQTTCYHVGDDGDYEAGQTAAYTVLDTGPFAGTTAIDVPHYAAATLTFAAADKSITDSAAGLVTFLDADTIRVRGSASNDGVYTIASGGGTAGHFHVTEALIDEVAGAYVTLCKRSTPSNNLVMDNITGLMWKRYNTGTTGSVEKVGPASNGLLNWYDVTKCFTIHAAAADLQMTTSGLKIVGGAAEVAVYFVGAVIVCSGFANAVNNLPGYCITAVTVNGADLDISLSRLGNTLIAEAAGGSRDIKIVCRSIYSYCGAANAASFGEYTDWRGPDSTELYSLMDNEAATAAPNATAFPNWPSGATGTWSTTTRADSTTRAQAAGFLSGFITADQKINHYYCALVRGGTNGPF